MIETALVMTSDSPGNHEGLATPLSTYRLTFDHIAISVTDPELHLDRGRKLDYRIYWLIVTSLQNHTHLIKTFSHNMHVAMSYDILNLYIKRIKGVCSGSYGYM